MTRIMWALTTLITASTLVFSLLQSSTPAPERQSSSSEHSGQTGQASSSGTNSKESASTGVGAAQPVITVRGLCDDQAPAKQNDSHGCEKVITRQQFEKLLDVLNPSGQAISPHARQNFAQLYAESMALEAAARKSGLEDTTEFSEIMNWMRLRAVSDLYRRTLQEKYRTTTPEEIDAYYKQHLASYDRVKLQRILIPRENPGAQDKSEFEKKALQAANAARDRAAKGEDPGQIQKDVYSTLGLASPPPTELGNYGRANFIEKEGADVFALKPGEVSQIEIEPKNYVIYKVADKKTLAEDEVKNEISRAISEQKFKSAIKLATDSARPEFNEQYFGPGMVLPENIPAKPATPPSH